MMLGLAKFEAFHGAKVGIRVRGRFRQTERGKWNLLLDRLVLLGFICLAQIRTPFVRNRPHFF